MISTEPQTKIQETTRLYVAQTRFNSSAKPFQGLSSAAVLALDPAKNILQCAVPKDMPIKTVWPCMVFDSGAGTWLGNFDLCASLDGQECFRMKLCDFTKSWNGGADLGRKWFSLMSQREYFPVTEGVHFLSYPTVINWWIGPIYLNITCDCFYINVVNVAATNWTGNIFVRSERGL